MTYERMQDLLRDALAREKVNEKAITLLREVYRVTSGASGFAEQKVVWQQVREFLAELTPGTVQTPGQVVP